MNNTTRKKQQKVISNSNDLKIIYIYYIYLHILHLFMYIYIFLNILTFIFLNCWLSVNKGHGRLADHVVPWVFHRKRHPVAPPQWASISRPINQRQFERHLPVQVVFATKRGRRVCHGSVCVSKTTSSFGWSELWSISYKYIFWWTVEWTVEIQCPEILVN